MIHEADISCALENALSRCLISCIQSHSYLLEIGVCKSGCTACVFLTVNSKLGTTGPNIYTIYKTHVSCLDRSIKDKFTFNNSGRRGRLADDITGYIPVFSIL